MDATPIPATLEKHRQFFSTQRTKDISFRQEMLRRMLAAVEAYEQKLTRAIYLDLRKAPFETYATEIGWIKKEIRFHLKNLKKWAKPKRVKTPLIHFPASSFIYQEPYGVVLIIAPWNYPFYLLFNPLIGAISAGNCVVLKPSSRSPHTSSVIEELITHTFDREYVSVFLGGREINQALWKEKFDYIFFTGNSEHGKVVMEAASKNLTPVTLELGGKCPCIVDREAKINFAARRIAWGKFLNAGQVCVSPDYLLVDREIKEPLVEALKKAVREFFGENPEKSPDFPRIINEKHFERICRLLEKGRILEGGKTNTKTRYIAPTIMDNISPHDPIMKEEIFGPLLPLIEYENLEDAISFVNSRPKPLASYFFSENRKKQKKVISHTSSGGACINDTIIHLGSTALPFGGVGRSGMGAYHGKASFDTFSHRKSVMRKSNLIDIKVRYAPYRGKMKIIKLFLQ
ncbi:MAG: aldehyde dehydrogenase [Candidatus Aminicenantales bacterium]